MHKKDKESERGMLHYDLLNGNKEYIGTYESHSQREEIKEKHAKLRKFIGY